MALVLAKAEVICPAMVTLKTTRPPNQCEWMQFKCKHPSPTVHTHTRFAPSVQSSLSCADMGCWAVFRSPLSMHGVIGSLAE